MASDSALVTPITLGGAPATQAPAAPTGLTATAASANEIDLTWTYASNVTYNVFRSTASGFTPASNNQIATGLSVAAYHDLSLTASTTYYYVVEAVNSIGSSPASAQVSATTLASGGTTAGSNTLYLVGGATATTPSQLSFTAGASGADSMIANNPQTVGTPENPLVYTIKGINGTYNPTISTIFNLYVDAGANAGEGAQAEIIYDMLGDGTQLRTELYSLFATDPVVGYEDYQQNSRGGLSSSTGTLANMTNGTVTVEIWDALPGANSQPISLSVGNNISALSDLVIPFTGITQSGTTTGQAPAAPTGLTATAASANEIDLAWTYAANVTYNVFRSKTSGFIPAPGNRITPTAISATEFNDTGLTASTTYYYLVEATNANGNSAASNQASATTNSATIPQSINFTALASPVIYGVAPITLNATATSNLPVTFSVTGPATVNNNMLTIIGAGPVNITASQNGNGIYTAATPVSQTIVVNKAILTVTANNANMNVGAALPTLTASYSGFVGTDTSAVLSGAPSLTTTATSSSGPGTYPITAAQGTLSAANYSFNFVNGTLSVVQPPTVVLITTATLTGSAGGGYTATVTVTNNGTGPASNVQLNSATLGATTGSPLPQSLGTLAAGGGSATVTVNFPGTAGSDGARAAETYTGTSSGGTFSANIRAVLP
jgi:hypothetical protein